MEKNARSGTMELNKEALREEFSKHYKDYYSTELFEREGFKRRRCKICGRYFWSIEDRDTCDDPSHTKYTFFKENPINIKYVDFWKKFEEFFRKNGHEVIKRYPVVSRWRPDLYFTIASIQDFQRLENGVMNFEYSANPLIVPQICLRFSDIENVGVTGRHFTSFMMAGQHAFNWPKEGYWRDRTIELNFEFLTKVLGVKKEKLVYHEDVWAMGDFSEFGPCLESFSQGNELVNSVFTQFQSFNGKVSELPGKVVDVGWGFERLLWFYTGHENAYEAVFHDELERLRKELGIKYNKELFHSFSELAGSLNADEVKDLAKLEHEIFEKTGITKEVYRNELRPLQALYSILDHTRTLLFAITDGALPSNIGGGYNLRVILRRSFSFIDEYKFNIDITELAERLANELKPLYPELSENIDVFRKVVEIERKRYDNSKEHARKIVSDLLAKKKELSAETIKNLYESHGVTPEFLKSVAEEKGVSIEIPENIYSSIIESDFARKEKEKKINIELPELPKTEQLYYSFATESKSTILFVKDNYLVLDKTPFYPEGGGQEADHGTINGIEVVDVQKLGDVIVHVMKERVEGNDKFKVGELAEAKVDIERRNRLIAHHTATHLISATCREVLGKHAWQEGSNKGFSKAHIDIAHYDKLSESEVKEIERRVNEKIFNGIKVSVEEMERGEAEGRFGFTIYQGHGIPAKKMRIVIITSKDGKLIDAEACGGLHAVNREHLLGIIKIINTSRVHDGVVRLEYVAGPAALDYFEMEHSQFEKLSPLLNLANEKIYDGVLALKDKQKELFDNYKKAVDIAAKKIAEQMGEKSEYVIELDAPVELMRALASELTEKRKCVALIKGKSYFVCISSSDKSAIDFAKEKLGSFSGGGSKKVAEGRLGG
ncbi:MAG: alanine--tRNA ligase [Candidatus Micrarchaeota archaeon]